MKLAIQAPFIINSIRDELLHLYAIQIRENVKSGAPLGQQVRQVTHMIHASCYLENKRDPGKELTLESLETTLYKMVCDLEEP